MTKELQDKIIRLQAQKNQQQSEYIQKKQHYESIIQQLQNENQKLQKYIQDNESFSIAQSQAMSSKSSKVNSPVHKYCKDKQLTDDERQLQPNLSDLVEENKFLKDQLVELTKTYEQQMQKWIQLREQMSNYFNKIQETYTIITQKMRKNSPNQRQISDLVKAYENLLKDFQSERLKYVEKIEQLTNYIMKADQKQKKMQEENQQLQIQLKIVKQELKIYKRSKIIK